MDDTTNVCARCGTTVSGVWSSLADPDLTYCWNCWNPAYVKAEKAGESFAQTMKRLLEPIVSPENLAATVTRAVEDATHRLRREIETIRYYMNHDNEAEVDEAMARGEFIDPPTIGDFDTASCYNCRTTYPIQDLTFVAINRPWCELCLSRVRCDHEWVDATNEAIESGEVCTKCFAVRATVSEEEKELRKQGATAFNYIYLSDGTRRLLGTNLGNRDAKELECVEKTVVPDSGAGLVIKPSEGESIAIGEPRRTEVRNVLPNPVLLCECCADRGKWWKFNEHCDKCEQTGWSDKGVWAKTATDEEAVYAMDLSMYLSTVYRDRASEMAVRLAFHIDHTTNYVPDVSKLIDAVFPTAQTIQRGASDGC